MEPDPGQKLAEANHRSLADEWLGEGFSKAAQERRAAERAAMSPEQLMKLERQIEAAKRRSNEGENVRDLLQELRAAHFRGNGSTGG